MLVPVAYGQWIEELLVQFVFMPVITQLRAASTVCLNLGVPQLVSAFKVLEVSSFSQRAGNYFFHGVLVFQMVGFKMFLSPLTDSRISALGTTKIRRTIHSPRRLEDYRSKSFEFLSNYVRLPAGAPCLMKVRPGGAR